MRSGSEPGASPAVPCPPLLPVSPGWGTAGWGGALGAGTPQLLLGRATGFSQSRRCQCKLQNEPEHFLLVFPRVLAKALRGGSSRPRCAPSVGSAGIKARL